MRQHDKPPVLGVLAGALEHLAKDVQETREDVKVIRGKVELLNDWHNRVTGALWVIGSLASVGLAVGLVILKMMFV